MTRKFSIIHLLYVLVFLCIVFVVYCEDNKDKAEIVGNKKMLILSFDGLGKHYLSNSSWDNLRVLFGQGSYAREMRNQFPTVTFGNHFTISTGLYAESHGVIGNKMYDPELHKSLDIDSEEYYHQNNEVMPLWTLNEMNGGRSVCLMWPGCSTPYHDTKVTYSLPYNRSTTLTKLIDDAMEWLTRDTEPANLVFLYFWQPDNLGHIYGPNSDFVLQELEKIDEAIGLLYKRINYFELENSLDLIITSDHGMSEVNEADVIELDKYVDSSLYELSGGSPILGIWPKTGQLHAIYDPLKKASKENKFSVYLKEEIPEAWHYKNNPRVSPLIVIADEGFVFSDMKRIFEGYKAAKFPQLTNHHGVHGYPTKNDDMEPIFVAVGPSFKKCYQIPPFENVDLYPLVAQILDLPVGPNDGDIKRVESMLSFSLARDIIYPILIALGVIGVLILIIGLTTCSIVRNDRQRKKSAENIVSDYAFRKPIKTESIGEEEERLLDEMDSFEV